LSNEVARANDLQDLLVVVLDQRELEPVFRWVNGNGSRPRRPIETVDRLALDAREIYRLVERTDDAIVAV